MTETSPNTAFGRVDADGTVYVRTTAGERAVGSWHAGTPAEGLAHFARKYDDMATEVSLLKSRLDTGSADAMQALSTANRLRESLETANVVGDLDTLASHIEDVVKVAEQAAEAAKQQRLAARAAAVARKQELVAEAEQLASESTQWKAAGDRLRDILEEWKTIKGVDRKTDAELWKRFAGARDAFNRRRGSHFASLDAARKQAQAAKEDLVSKAESLSESTQWQDTANQLKGLMAQWKQLPRASREAEDRLWKRFRAAQDHFFTERGKAFAERDEQWLEHQKQKEELLAQAEQIDVSGNVKQAQSRLRTIQAKWDRIGRVPREAAAGLDRRLRAVEDAVRAAVDATWQSKSAAANPLLAQMREQVAKAAAQVERAEQSGDQAKISEARAALESKQSFLELAERAS